MLSQFFILSPRGDVIIRRDYLGNIPQGSSDIFYRKLRFWKENDEAPPIFIVDGVSYIHSKEAGVILVATTKENISPALVLELLKRTATLIKDYCGVISEDAIRKNFILIYELLDEILDYGFPQTTATDALKSFVLSQPVAIKPTPNLGKGSVTFGMQKGPTGVFKSVLDTSRTDGKRKDEIFVDVVERVTCVFNASGYMQSSQIDGSIQVRSYLSGNPAVKIKLRDNLVVGRQNSGGLNDAVILDDVSYHECAQMEMFDIDRSITLVPPDGEFALMNYRVGSSFPPPFRVYTSVDEDQASSMKAYLTLKVRCELPRDKGASALEVEVPMPKSVQRVSCDGSFAKGQQIWDWKEKTRTLVWKFKSMKGGEEALLAVRATLDKPYGTMFRRDVGPVNVKFTAPNYSASRMQLQYLHIMRKDWNYNPSRWVRYVTSSTSYIFRT
ncbi:hypothetical protein BSKO_00998 [Bryopsis sp. KO-2023]|nr:hypothetical protein BSKO_00998 [Bryopsis sp. KO-2023]